MNSQASKAIGSVAALSARSTSVNRWDEKAGLRTGCYTLPNVSGHSRFALARHRKHMNAAMAAAYFAAPPEERVKAIVAYGTDLQAEVRALIDEANQLRATAVRERDVRAALKGIDSALKALELYAKLSGQLRGPQHNHLHLHAEAPSREEAVEAARECLEVFAPHLLAGGAAVENGPD